MLRRSWLLIAGLLLTSSACARRSGTAADAGEAQPAGAPVRLNVTNNYALPMNVYAEAAGTSYRMGLVAPGIAGSFELRQSMVGGGPVEFWAQAGAGGAIVRSGRLLLSPGAVVDFEIMTQLTSSHATIRP